jgi:hypothetical protein
MLKVRRSYPVKSESNTGMATHLESAIAQLLAVHEMLSSDSPAVDGRALSDFRDALNRVRNTAWAAQKFVASSTFDDVPAGLSSFLASERVRCAFQLCSSLKEDLQRQDIEFQKGQLLELQVAVTGLSKQLHELL